MLGHWTGARTRSKQEASARGTAQKSLLGRRLHRQSKGKPLVQNQNKKRHGQMASVLKSAARSSKKGSARCSRFAARFLSPENVHACTDHGAHGIYSAWRCKIIAAHGNKKKGFFHAFQRRQSDLLLLQAAATSFKHEGFAAIRTPRTGSARLMGALRVLRKMVSARSMLPLGSAL